MKLIDAASRKVLRVLNGHKKGEYGGRNTILAWSPDGRILASGSLDDNVVRLWGVPNY